MKNYTFRSSTEENDDSVCIQCVIARKDAFALLETLAIQLHTQEIGEGTGDIRIMLFGGLALLQEFQSSEE